MFPWHVLAHGIGKLLDDAFSSERSRKEKETNAILAACLVIAVVITVFILWLIRL